ncbi:M20/M25/M40 family metallo-hydrolase [Paractinoplanes toevensis]|uniref:Acetyl-lysine deacetylase n=1 Tax=Paractinoplanes toevensis TaxID=571911 RepID=A0A919WB91_9ACTN|nr:M20/M25/M40 family metallo-hydrolase [Actinoplanes toevensis]GIM97027.1 acetyl-lysine deacetylase [Actinoplanes toevensis]
MNRTEGCPDTIAVGLLRSLIEIPSPSYGEARLAEHLVGVLRELGFTAHVDKAGNAVGVIDRGPGPTVMLLGHMDTVPEQIPVRAEQNRLYGRGAVDAKGPLATMVCAAATAHDYHGRIVVVGAVEEETPLSRGAVLVRDTHEQPDALIIGEPSGWDNVVLGYKGKLDLAYRVSCPATHPSSPAPKAAELAAEAWSVLLDLLGRDAIRSSFDAPWPCLVSIRGDLVEAEAELSIRTPPGFDDEALIEGLRRRLPDGELHLINTIAACRVDRPDPVVRALAAGIRSQQGRPSYKVKTGTSDMNTLAVRWNIPMATYGPGDSRLDHADDEHILLTDYLRGIEVLRHALTELAGDLPGRVRRRHLTLASGTTRTES